VVGPQTEAGLAVIEARAEAVGAPLLVHGQHWHAWEERGRLIFQDENGLLDLTRPALPGAHQIENAAAAVAALRVLVQGEQAAERAMTDVFWPARMQRLRRGPLAEAAPQAELWLDGGHNASAGEALARHLAGLAARPTWLICGMLNTKDVRGYLRPMSGQVEGLYAVSIPEEVNTLPASATAAAARGVGMAAEEADSVDAALAGIVARDPTARILLGGSLYLAGQILRENG
jgi:dihydrofolate synthase / folylpolyglutamate synthase